MTEAHRGQFIVIGENIHATRVVLRAGQRVVALALDSSSAGVLRAGLAAASRGGGAPLLIAFRAGELD